MYVLEKDWYIEKRFQSVSKRVMYEQLGSLGSVVHDMCVILSMPRYLYVNLQGVVKLKFEC